MTRMLKRLVALACAFFAAGPGGALAASSPVVADCNAHGRLTQSYTVPQLRTALVQMPADVQEYTNCYNVVQSALLAKISGKHTNVSGSSASSGGSSLPTAVIVVIVVLALGGATAGAVAIRRRGTSE